MSADASTPLMRQYHGIKQQVPNALLLFRLGDFYELFFEDAVTAARELEITLTARNKEKGHAIPMCGVRYDAAEINPALETLDAREALGPTGVAMTLPCLKTDVEPWVFGADYATRSLSDHFRLLALDGCGLEGRPLATGAAAAVLHYLRDTQ